MLKFVNYNIVFQEVPDEVSLAINISGCPNKCFGCHSPYLMEDLGECLNKSAIDNFLFKYANSITCICFMGGDNCPGEVAQLAEHVKSKSSLKIAWYSGKETLPSNFSLYNFDFIKLGPYIQSLGGLNSPNTNQKFYKVENLQMIDMSSVFTELPTNQT